MSEKDQTHELADIFVQAMSEGLPAEEVYQSMLKQGFPAELVEQVLKMALNQINETDEIQPAQGGLDFLAKLAVQGRQLLASGSTTIDVFQLAAAQCDEFFDQGSAEGIGTARAVTEAISSVYYCQLPQPLDESAFLQAVSKDLALIQQGPPEGRTIPLYPGSLPSQFFHDSTKFLQMCDRMGGHCLDTLWKTTRGCQGVATGAAHNGHLKDNRPYLVLRLPPPQQRFEAHFVAFVGTGAGSLPRMFAMERGVNNEESVLCECYADGGRLRLGVAGPAESTNFIRLVRQQLGI